MTVSRRNVLLQGSVIGAGIIAANMPGVVALAQAQQLPKRRSLAGLAWNDPIVATYRDAVGIMKQKPNSDKFSWVSLAEIHGFDPNNYHFCPHGNWYFLPWHRAYTLTYERIIRNLTGHKDFALPYWDWTSNPKMPAVFLNPQTPDGKTNWLYVSDSGFMRTWPNNKAMPASNVGPAVLKQILKATTYEQFGTSRPRHPKVQNSLDPSWIVAQDSGDQGVLEGNAHNNVHNNIGGWMPSAISPRDPIFFMHHCNIDRIWAMWNLHHHNSTDHLWTDMPFKDNFINVDGTPSFPKVSDLFVPENLGYTYGLPAPAQTAAPAVAALDEKVRTLFAVPDVSNAAGIKTFVGQNTQRAGAAANKYLEIPVEVDAGLMSAVARRAPVPSGTEELDFAQAMEQAATGTRALGFIRDVAVTQPHETMYRVFIDADDLSQDTPTSDPQYVGTFGVLDHGAHGGQHSPPSFVLDLTDAIQHAHGSSATPPGRVRVQILPVSSKGTVDKTGTATPSQVEIAFVSS
jgi:tyrosinase